MSVSAVGGKLFQSASDEFRVRTIVNPFVRVALINYGDAARTVVITVSDDPRPTLWFMSDTSSEDQPEVPVTPQPAPGQPWRIEIPPGHVYGFWTFAPVRIEDPGPVSIVTARDKDPWPTPPPPPPRLADLAVRYYDRFKSFILAGGSGSDHKITITIEPGTAG